ncbi:MAG: cell division protein SepF [Christensenellales bacterium]|jgi:cell division inhibitor SepF
MAKGGFVNKMLDLIGLVDVDDPDNYDYDDDLYEDEVSPQQYEQYEEDLYEEPPARQAPPPREKPRKERSKVIDMNNRNQASAQQPHPRASMKMLVYRPMSYDDTQSIIDELAAHRPVIVNLEELDLDIAQRMLDFMSGAVYAISGSIFKVANGIFVVAPSTVAIGGNVPDEMQQNGFYSPGGAR